MQLGKKYSRYLESLTLVYEFEVLSLSVESLKEF